MLLQFKHKSRHDTQPKVTFYLTLVFELHTDGEQYTYSIDRCYTSLAQANDRLGLLSRCNTNPKIREILRVGEDQDTGCQWSTWTRPGEDAGTFRFFAEVKRIVMNGAIRHDGPTEEDAAHFAGGLASTPEYRYAFEHKKDLADHVWVVALHNPERKSAVDSEGRPTALPWALEGVYEASGNAMARGKRLWRDKLSQRQGRFDRMDSHYGLARYLLVPHETSKAVAVSSRQSIGSGQSVPLTESTAQVRIERIKVTSQGEMVAMFAPAEAILFDKPFQPLCKGREHERERKAVAKVEAELLDLFNAAGEDAAEHNIAVPVPAPASAPDPRSLTPPPIRKRTLQSPQQQPFRPGVVQEYGQLAATLRQPATPASFHFRPAPKTVVSKSVASAKKHFYHTLEKDGTRNKLTKTTDDMKVGSAAKKETDKNRRKTWGFDVTLMGPPVTPGQAALAAQQTLMLASRVNRG
ncbi:hypothetical protein MBLNU13_g03386t1 [Cladosporium sp. NU13]